MANKEPFYPDCRYEEEQEIQQVAFRFMKKREKERKAQAAKERAKAEKERVKAQKKAAKAPQKTGSGKKSVVFPLLEKDTQMSEGGGAGDGYQVLLPPEAPQADSVTRAPPPPL
nr:uncharacterized protein LOC123773325 [Procambarus clarkii]